MKAYIETTIFNRYFEDDREYAADSRRLFDCVSTGKIEAYTSLAVLDELKRAPEPKQSQMLALIKQYGVTVLEIDDMAYQLADVYIEMGIIPARFRYDGIHIAMAAVFGLDCIISLNFHHINKLKTKTATEIIHRMKGYSTPYICTPSEVIYDDE